MTDQPSARAETRTLEALLEASATGDRTAMAAVYAETSPRAYGLALRVVGDPALAEDVTREAYGRIWRTAAGFDPGAGTARSWVLGVVHRLAVDRVRRVRARVARRADVFDRSPFARLPHRQRRALELTYLDGRTCASVADELGLATDDVAALVRDGLRAVRDDG